MHYRKEIDGLRAIAVVPVILFHAGLGPFSGGYVGVDIFFVISGYLITSILIEDLDKGQFSLLQFYERRARRILPALFFVLAFCCVFATLWIPPEGYKAFGEGLASVILFASNIFFWSKTDYFAPSSEENPLLHTWSLAVEEQYYLIFPILLFLIWRFGPSRVMGLFVALSLISLTVSISWAQNHASAGFFLLPARAWELLAGSICALLLIKKKIQPNVLFAFVGLICILASVFLFDETTPFPSFYAILPVLGTALIILFAREGNVVARLLSLKACVGIGLISYSAYLWHHPLFAFARLRSLSAPEAEVFLFLTVLTFCMAYLSWRFIERPFRGAAGAKRFSRRAIFKQSIAGMGLFLVIGGIAGFTDGLRNRFPAEIVDILESADRIRDRSPCFISQIAAFDTQVSECLLTLDQQQPLTVFFGDSHATGISKDLRAALAAENQGLITFQQNGCLPVAGIRRERRPYPNPCTAFVEAANAVIKQLHPKAVVLTGRWALGLEGTRFNNQEGGIEYGDNNIAVPAPSSLAATVEEQINASLTDLATHTSKLVIISQIPEAGWSVPDRFIKQLLWGDGTPLLTTSHDVYQQRNAATQALWQSFSSVENIAIVPADAVFCNQEQIGRCINAAGTTVYYSDDDHVSPAGSKRIVDHLMTVLP